MSRHIGIDRRMRGSSPQWLGKKPESFAPTPWTGGATQSEAAPAHDPQATSAMKLSLQHIPIAAPVIQALGEDASAADSYEKEAHAVAQDLSASQAHKVKRPISRMGGGQGGLKGMPAPVNAQINQQINRARSGGAQLPESLSKQMGSQLGADLHGVRVHHDSQADGLNRMLNARAFTSGRDVFFRHGHYNPSSSSGRSVLAHELTHVVQQCGPSSQRGAAVSAAPVQRLVLQLGAHTDKEGKITDHYLANMMKRLIPECRKEDYVIGTMVHSEKDKPFDPKKKKYNFKKRLWEETDQTNPVLGKMGKKEKLRIVSHGYGDGRVGGYTADRLAELIIRLGLKKSHEGGIDIHACLPAYDDGKKRQPTVVLLQDKLKEEGYEETVRGYQHCIFPSTTSTDYEVSKQGWSLWTDVVVDLEEAWTDHEPELPLVGIKKEQKIDRIKIIRDLLGDQETKRLLAICAPDGKVVPFDKMHLMKTEIQKWMTKNNHFFEKPRLRRANSVRLNSDQLLAAEEQKRIP